MTIKPEHKKILVITLYFLASAVLIYTIYNVYAKYTMPYVVGENAVYESLKEARNYQLAGNILYICSFLLPGIYLAWRNKEFRMKFPAIEILQLLVINVMILR